MQQQVLQVVPHVQIARHVIIQMVNVQAAMQVTSYREHHVLHAVTLNTVLKVTQVQQHVQVIGHIALNVIHQLVRNAKLIIRGIQVQVHVMWLYLQQQ